MGLPPASDIFQQIMRKTAEGLESLKYTNSSHKKSQNAEMHESSSAEDSKLQLMRRH